MAKHVPLDFDKVPSPRDQQQADLAQALGMIVVSGMEECLRLEQLHAETLIAPARFSAEVSSQDETMWLIQVTRI